MNVQSERLASLCTGGRARRSCGHPRHRVIAPVGVASPLMAIGAHLTLKELVQRRLACIRYALEARVQCPRCKASLTEMLKIPSIALGVMTFCPHCGLSLIEPYAG